MNSFFLCIIIWFQHILQETSLYRVGQEDRPLHTEVTVPVIMRKRKGHMKMCTVVNGYRDRAVWIWHALFFPYPSDFWLYIHFCVLYKICLAWWWGIDKVETCYTIKHLHSHLCRLILPIYYAFIFVDLKSSILITIKI